MLRIFTGVWGNHIHILERACARSLSWPKNKDAIKDAIWHIACDSRSHESVMKVMDRVGVRGECSILDEPYRKTMTQAWGRQMSMAVDTGSMFLLALPDVIFGDGSIQNMIEVAKITPHSCVSVAHTRSVPEIMDSPYLSGPLGNARLFMLSWNHFLHASWRDAEIGPPQTNTWMSGIAWKKIDKGLYAVTHKMPSTFLAQIVKSDLKAFESRDDFAVWDHVLGAKFARDRRLRIIGSSDLAFITEVTEPFDNLAELTDIDIDNPTAFHGKLLHNRHAGVTEVIFREG